MFLKNVSKNLLDRFGNNLSNVTVVFPGKRARLFMNQYLTELSDSPVWAPHYQTIDELYTQLSPYRKVDTIVAVCELYSIYAELVPDAEPLDEFYSWGEIILSDFDDIDKHIAPAEKIFRNVYDLQSISTDYLSPEQKEALRSFFSNFNPDGNSHIKEQFLRLWTIMPDLYHGLIERLKSKGQLYSGALYREVATRIRNDEKMALPEQQTYVFVGFNILDECEETLFRYCKQQHNALFYWDYDKLYTSDPIWEAGHFINQNLSTFHNALTDEHFDNLRHLKDITFVATSTDNAQCRFIPTWIENHITERENETAVVLSDEHLLGGVLHSIPEGKPSLINVTMGFPMVDTPVYSFLNVLMSLYIDGFDRNTGMYRYTFMEKVKRHPYYKLIHNEQEENNALFIAAEIDSPELLRRLLLTTEKLSSHYADKEQQDIYDQLYVETLFQCHKLLTRFVQLTTPADATTPASLNVNPQTLRRLLKQLMSNTSIPFHGEPAIGMQVMGLLETRNIDFKNLLMLSVGEGILPKKNDDNSLIPHSLRETFNLTTIRHKNSVFAYYFFRLISHAEHVTLVYNENSSGATSNEMSRFMRQLMAETDLPIRHVRLMPSNERTENESSNCVIKTPEMIQELREHYINNKKHKLSPTAINTYLNCRLKYYYKYIAHIKPMQDTADGISPAVFGTTFHDAANIFYLHLQQHYGTNVFNADMLLQEVENKELRIHPYVDLSLIINYFKPIEDELEKEEKIKRFATMPIQEIREYVGKFYSQKRNQSLLNGINHIIHRVLTQYLTHLVEYDTLHAPFTLEGLERDSYYSLQISPSETILTGGRIDRLERDKDGLLSIIDYKTGGSASPINGLQAVFEHKAEGSGYFLQTLIYSLAVQDENHGESVRPNLFYVNQAGRPSSYDRSMYFGTKSNHFPILDITPYRQEFIDKLTETIRSIFDPTIPFDATSNASACTFCEFRRLCQ